MPQKAIDTITETIPLSPKIRKRQERARQRIITESACKFVERGFENVSVEEIIESAEIARSSFYRFFSNREQILATIVRPVFEQGTAELKAIETRDPVAIMDGIFDTYLRLWHASPDSLRVATRTGGVYFYLFQDVHETFRKTLIGLIKQVESTDLLLNDSADYTARLIARCAVPAMEVYSDDPNFEALFRETMRGLLLKVGRRRPPSVDVDGDP